MTKRVGCRSALVLGAFGVLFTVLAVSSYTRMSATWDEPLHLTAGYMALRHGDYRFGIGGHPVLLRMWAALPLLVTPGVRADTSSPSYREGKQLGVSREFLYRDNDADRILYRARFMTVILGILLGVLLFLWARDLAGLPAASLVLAAYAFEPNILAHSGLVTTDMGATLFFFGTLYFLRRAAGRLTIGNALGVCLFFALAMVSKLSSLLLVPLMGLLLAARILEKEPWPVGGSREPVASRSRRSVLAAGLLLAAALATWAVVWGVYRCRWDLSVDPGLKNEFENHSNLRNVDPELRRRIESFDRLRLLPHAYTKGFLQQLGERQNTRYFGGEYRTSNFWYFYPAAFLLKTPTSVILLMLAGIVAVAFSGRLLPRDRLFILAPPAVYLISAMANPLNTGVRHLLPMYPFLLLAAGVALRRLLPGRRKWILGALGLLLAAEFAVIYPDCLASFNFAAGGPARGIEWLDDSNIDWGQGLKGLGEWMRDNRVPWVNLCYFGTADPAYYGMKVNFLPGSQFYEGGRPRLPGYVAVSLTKLYGEHSGKQLLDFYSPLRERRPVAVIRRAINVYKVESPWWQAPPGGQR